LFFLRRHSHQCKKQYCASAPSIKNTKRSQKEEEESAKPSNGEKAVISTVDSGDLVQENVSRQEGDTDDAIQPSLS
jgi:hypothetical protein